MFFCQRVESLGDGVVVEKGIDGWREKVSKSSVCLHFFEYFVYCFVPVFFCVLFIEYTVGLILESGAPETEGAVVEKSTIEYVRAIANIVAHISVLTFSASSGSVKMLDCSQNISIICLF